jgi:release factor glutamine methyltransferase
MTIQEALHVSERTVSYRDAEVLLGSILAVDRSYLHTHPEQVLTPKQNEAYEAFLLRREQNEPVAYITGVKEFYGREFLCDTRALIPRPETEGVVERALAFLPAYFQAHITRNNLPCPLRILELGTGSGCIAISLALELAKIAIPATIIATDIAPEALELAAENWKKLSQGSPVGNIQLTFVTSDLYTDPSIQKHPFDLILANLPYVPLTWKVDPAAQPEVVFHEPDVALFGGDDGLEIYRRFFSETPTHLEKDGAVIIEHGEDQTTLIRPLAEAAFPRHRITTFQDYANLDRILEILPLSD